MFQVGCVSVKYTPNPKPLIEGRIMNTTYTPIGEMVIEVELDSQFNHKFKYEFK